LQIPNRFFFRKTGWKLERTAPQPLRQRIHRSDREMPRATGYLSAIFKWFTPSHRNRLRRGALHFQIHRLEKRIEPSRQWWTENL